MNALLTGGAGFIGRWVSKRLLEDGHSLWIVDDLSNGRKENLDEFNGHSALKQFVIGDIKDENLLTQLFSSVKFDICYHLGASINIQDSIDNPRKTFNNDTVSTFYIMELCRRHGTKVLFMSTCMVYDRCFDERGITETHPTKPASPYAGAKIAAENMVLSYYYTYGLPVVIVRPFNTYGPFQKSSGEGGVVAIFIERKLNGEMLNIYGNGTQTRDLLYVEDCAHFVVEAGYSSKLNGEIVNAGMGRDITINDLAKLIVGDESKITRVPHIHPQSEIQKLLCNYDKANYLLGWVPKVTLEDGINKTEDWIKTNLPHLSGK